MIPQGGGYQHASNIFPSGGRGDVKEAAASIDAARTDDVRRNPTDAHQRRPLRGRSSACPQAAPPLPFLRGCSANSSGGRAAGHPRPLPRSAPADTCFCSPPRTSSEGAHGRRCATGAFPPRGFPGFHQPGYVFRLFLFVTQPTPFHGVTYLKDFCRAEYRQSLNWTSPEPPISRPARGK